MGSVAILRPFIPKEGRSKSTSLAYDFIARNDEAKEVARYPDLLISPGADSSVWQAEGKRELPGINFRNLGDSDPVAIWQTERLEQGP